MTDYSKMPAGREMDKAVCDAVGIEPLPGQYWYPMKRISDTVIVPDWDDKQSVYPDVSTSIAAAWKVVEKASTEGPHKWWISNEHDVWYANAGGVAEAQADTAPLAICRAALKEVAG